MLRKNLRCKTIMIIRSKFSWLFLPVLFLSVQLSNAQAPSGTLIFNFDNSTPIWDISGSYHVVAPVEGAGGTPTDISFDVDITQDARGRITGSSGTTFTVGQDVLFGMYTVRGKVSSSGGVTRATMTVTLTGDGTISGRSTHFVIRANYSDVEPDPESGELFGNARASAHFSKLGNARDAFDFSAPLPSGMDGTWTLALDVTPLNKIRGTATITLSNGRNLPFNVNGSYSGRSDSAKMQLSGTGTAKGSRLKVITSGESLYGVKGNVLGQKVVY